MYNIENSYFWIILGERQVMGEFSREDEDGYGYKLNTQTYRTEHEANVALVCYVSDDYELQRTEWVLVKTTQVVSAY